MRHEFKKKTVHFIISRRDFLFRAFDKMSVTETDSNQKAKTLYDEGIRALSLDDYENSVEKLGEACQLQ